MINDHFSNPLSTKTPTMTVAAILEWLDLEVTYLKGKYEKETSDAAKIILMGTWLHLQVMKAQLEEHTLQQLDEDNK